ncbi:DUF1499 domain-containing protein [Roseovarius sp. CAU 1744]|uniref:DUF1499 domain-containing protein n=1 Tax=Roseovarius sp. CAU 1744 TaxID=3140368 RepID=UPI00325BCB28
MKGWFLIGLVIFLIVLGAAIGWVRIAPVDVARWHQRPDLALIEKRLNGAIRMIDADGDSLARLDAIIRQTPRTRHLAGSVDEGMITYVTRSAVFGFPDFTTVVRRDRRLEIYGRARFGVSDLGVNAARIDGWLDALAQGG